MIMFLVYHLLHALVHPAQSSQPSCFMVNGAYTGTSNIRLSVVPHLGSWKESVAPRRMIFSVTSAPNERISGRRSTRAARSQPDFEWARPLWDALGRPRAIGIAGWPPSDDGLTVPLEGVWPGGESIVINFSPKSRNRS